MAPPPPSTLIDMTRDLVRVPSRAGIDPYGPVVAVLAGWLDTLGLPHRTLDGAGGQPIAVVSEVGAGAGPSYVLDATFDTAPFGDPAAWRTPPTAGAVEDGWLRGRGAADSKAGAAIFAHVAAALAGSIAGRLVVLFDGDEHAGTFAGARAYFDQVDPEAVDGVMIGYPGNDRLVVGGRGFLRARLVVHGLAAHSGSAHHRGANAIEKAARLVLGLALPPDLLAADPALGLPPALTVTQIGGGEGFSAVPDRCELTVDVRLTTAFGAEEASAWLHRAAGELDGGASGPPSEVEVLEAQPPFRTPPQTPFVAALAAAGERVFGRPVPARVAGPSNLANYVAGLGIPATAGLGVTYRGLHATDECAEVSSFGPVYEVYRSALQALLGAGATASEEAR